MAVRSPSLNTSGARMFLSFSLITGGGTSLPCSCACGRPGGFARIEGRREVRARTAARTILCPVLGVKLVCRRRHGSRADRLSRPLRIAGEAVSPSTNETICSRAPESALRSERSPCRRVAAARFLSAVASSSARPPSRTSRCATRSSSSAISPKSAIGISSHRLEVTAWLQNDERSYAADTTALSASTVSGDTFDANVASELSPGDSAPSTTWPSELRRV